MKISKKKILVVVPLSTIKWGSKSTGGVDSVCQMLVKGLSERKKNDYSYQIIAFDPTNSIETPGICNMITDSLGVIFFNIDNGKKWPNIFSQYFLIRKAVKTFNPDLVHTHLLSWAINIAIKVPVVTTLHGFKKTARKRQGLINNLIFEQVIPALSSFFVDRLTCVTNNFKEEVKESVNIPIDVVYNPIESSYFENKQVFVNERRFKIVTCGLLTKRKGIHHILNVLDKLKKLGHEVELCIIGPSSSLDYVNTLQETITECNLADSVVFVGHKKTSEIVEIYSKSDLGLFLSEEETFGLAPLEMLATGLHVISSTCGIMKDFVNQEQKVKNLILVQYDNYSLITKIITDIIKSNRIIETEENSIEIESFFAVENIVSQYEAIYEVMLNKEAI